MGTNLLWINTIVTFILTNNNRSYLFDSKTFSGVKRKIEDECSLNQIILPRMSMYKCIYDSTNQKV